MNSEVSPHKLYDVTRIRADFPILLRQVRPGVPLVYLDSAATSQKPASVIEAMEHYYQHTNANIHRGIHTLAEEATAGYEAAREKIARFIGAKSHGRLFYAQCNGSINLVAMTWETRTLIAGMSLS
jgi:cysteine desulfurase/selenocysteine lyase